jgi:hypothetical protein
VALEAVQMDPGLFHGSLTLLGTPLIVQQNKGQHFAPFVYGLVALIVTFAELHQAKKTMMAAIAAAAVSWFIARIWRNLDWSWFSFGGGDIVMPLYISSEHDEAYKLLHALANAADPLKSETRQRDNRWKRLAAVVNRAWIESTADRAQFSLRNAYSVGLLLAILILAFFLMFAQSRILSIYPFGALLGASVLLIALVAKHPGKKSNAIDVSTVVDSMVRFALQLAKYPGKQMGAYLARRLAWPFLKSNALGLSGAPGSIDTVNVAFEPQHQPDVYFEFKALPRDLIDRVFKDRQQSAQQVFSDALDQLSTIDWSPDNIRNLLTQLNQPNLIHSCYYRYLDQGWVLTEIAENIAYREYVEREDISALNAQLSREETRNAKYQAQIPKYQFQSATGKRTRYD